MMLSSLLCFGEPTQRCFGQLCNQNNILKKKQDFVSDIIETYSTEEYRKVEEEVPVVEHEGNSRRAKPEICVGGSPCNLNNFVKKKRAIVEAMVGLAKNLAEKEKREAQVQNCVHSLCEQNSSGRKKRAVVKAIVDEAQAMTEADLEQELKEEVAAGGAGNLSIFNSISAYLRGLFLLPDAQFNLRFLSGSPPPVTKDTPVKILECPGPITSFCKNHLCRVKCIDGRKVEMRCDSNSLDIKNTAVGENTSTNQVSCGQES